MVIYSIYNLDTLEKLIDSVDKMYNRTMWDEKLFAGKPNHCYHWYLSKDGVGHYAINFLLFLTMTRANLLKYMRHLSISCGCMPKQ